MKSFSTFCLLLLLVSCNSSEKKSSEVSSTEIFEDLKKQETTAPKDGTSLSQNGDYNNLFNRERNNCDFITSENLAKAIDVPESNTKEDNNSCNYLLIEENGHKTRFKFIIEDWGNEKILKEIKASINNAENFGKDSKLSQFKISETGDTYLSMHQNRMVRILNETQDKVIILLYSVENTAEETDIKEMNARKDIARERSYTIANYLLKNL